MFILNIFKKLTNIKEPKYLAISTCTIIFVLAMLMNGIFNFESIANAFYKYGSLVLVFGIFTLVLIFANIKKRRDKNISGNKDLKDSNVKKQINKEL